MILFCNYYIIYHHIYLTLTVNLGIFFLLLLLCTVKKDIKIIWLHRMNGCLYILVSLLNVCVSLTGVVLCCYL